MYILDIIPATKIPHSEQQIFSYFSSQKLLPGALVLVPLGKRKELGVVFDTQPIDDLKMEIKKADFKLRNICQVISSRPFLTKKQILLALWLGQYYFCSPGLFIKIMLGNRNAILKNFNQTKNKNSESENQKKRKPLSQKLILYPTLSLLFNAASKSPQTAIWHSGLTSKKIAEIKQKVATEQIKEIIGTRSAVFLPFANLKKIIIEDEINPAHRSWDMFPYWRTHEVAQKLAELFKAKLEIKSDLPSVESYLEKKNFLFLETLAKKPTLIVDMRTELKEGNSSIFSRSLQAAIKKILLANKESQAVFFINRRGEANFILCRDCGFIELCPQCEAPLAYHLVQGKPLLLCHRCGAQKLPPSLCPNCKSWRIKTFGAGTQKVENELKKLFPSLTILRLDRDSAPNDKKHSLIIKTFIEKRAQVLIGTQMIFNQNLPAVDLSAVLSLDTLLNLPDFLSGEKTWQIINLLKKISSNRLPIFIQTYNPENQILKWVAESNWQEFYQNEIALRKELNFPPFAQLIKLSFRHRQAKIAAQEAKFLATKLRQVNLKNLNVIIGETLPAFIPKEGGYYIWQIILKFPLKNIKEKNSEFLKNRNALLSYVPENWLIEVDPESLL